MPLSDTPSPPRDDAHPDRDQDSEGFDVSGDAREPGPRERREILREARQLSAEVPRLLYKHRHQVARSVMWEIADAVRALRVELKRPKRERSPAALRRLNHRINSLVERHVGFARRHALWDLSESLLIAFIIALFIRATLFEAFQIPSGSMIPTLRVGDRIFVSKFVYGVDLPFTDVSLFEWREPARGEVVVFEFPGPGSDHGKDFIKRIVAVAGDRVRLEDNLVLIDGKPAGDVEVVARSEPCQTQPGESCTGWPSGASLDVTRAVARERIRAGCPCTYLRESAGPYTWITQHVAPDVTCQCAAGRLSQVVNNTASWPSRGQMHNLLQGWTDDPHRWVHESPDGDVEMEVPPGYVLAMGDNRDFSSDGRDWGLVPVEAIKGKALLIWWAGHDWRDRLFRTVH